MTSAAPNSVGSRKWGRPPWSVEFEPERGEIPDEVDFAIVGGGFTGLATAAWLRHLDPSRTVALFEASRIGAGSSGHTGGMVLGQTAAGDLPGLGDVIAGLTNILDELQIACDLRLPGAWEIGRQGGREDSPIRWNDDGELGVVKAVPGGSVDPGKMVGGLARAGAQRGALIFENARVENLRHEEPVVLELEAKEVRAGHVLIASNAQSLELSGLAGRAQPKFTLAVATEPLVAEQIQAIGLAQGHPFYTVDLPYLWGRVVYGNRVIFGSGLVHLEDWRELLAIDVTRGEAAELLSSLETRVKNLHPALQHVRLSLRWGGPILIADRWEPVFSRHPANANVLVLGAYSGHGVALSVYLGAWAAEVMLGRRTLPQWLGEGSAAA
jgi:glycine/D-amino acid oxidase-like deaminating enzyme